MPLQSGARLGHYEVLSPVGAGGMGEVYKGKDPRLNRTVAIKVLPAHIAERAELRERFEREARAIAAFNHPHICIVHDVGRHDEIDFLSWSTWRARRWPTGSPKGHYPSISS